MASEQSPSQACTRTMRCGARRVRARMPSTLSARKVRKTPQWVPATYSTVASTSARMIAVPRSLPAITRTSSNRPPGSTGISACRTWVTRRCLRSRTAAAHRARASLAASEGCIRNPPMPSQLRLPPTVTPSGENATSASRITATPNAGQASALKTRTGRRENTSRAATPATAQAVWRRNRAYEPPPVPIASTEDEESTITRPSTVSRAVQPLMSRTDRSRARRPSRTRHIRRRSRSRCSGASSSARGRTGRSSIGDMALLTGEARRSGGRRVSRRRARRRRARPSRARASARRRPR